MTYETFKTKLLAQLAQMLPEDTHFEVQRILKNNHLVLDGLLISTPSVNVSPTIYLNYYYETYTDGVPFCDIAERIVACYEKYKLDNSVDVSFFCDFAKVKDYIIFKLVNLEQNTELLQDIPHIPYLDLAIVFCYFLPSGTCDALEESASATILIHNSHMGYWGTCAEDLLQIAKENTPRLFEPQLHPLSDMVLDLISPLDENGMSPDDFALDIPVYVLTNNRKFLGAATLLYHGILEKCAQTLDDDFYIIPSSIHEVLLLPSGIGSSAEDLTALVRDVNENHVAIEEILSNHVYFYNRFERQITC